MRLYEVWISNKAKGVSSGQMVGVFAARDKKAAEAEAIAEIFGADIDAAHAHEANADVWREGRGKWSS